MSTKTLLSLATIALFAATAKATEVSYGDTTKDWFNVDASAVTEEAISGSEWEAPSAGSVDVGTTIDVDTAATDPLKYALPGDKLSATSIRIDGTIASLTRNATTPGNDVFSTTVPQAAIVASDADGKWHLWHCIGDSAGEWVTTTATAPADAATDVHVAIEFTNENKVRYGTVSGGTTTWLTDNESTNPNGWLSNAKNYANIASVGLAGYGSFGDFGGLVVKTITIDLEDTELKKVIESFPSLTDADAEKADTVNETNHLTPKQSVLLGLSSESEKPYATPVQVSSGDKLGFKFGNVNLTKYGTNAYVTFDVYEYGSATDAANNANGTKKTDKPVSADSQAEIAVPEGTGVKYYKVKINFN